MIIYMSTLHVQQYRTDGSPVGGVSRLPQRIPLLLLGRVDERAARGRRPVSRPGEAVILRRDARHELCALLHTRGRAVELEEQRGRELVGGLGVCVDAGDAGFVEKFDARLWAAHTQWGKTGSYRS